MLECACETCRRQRLERARCAEDRSPAVKAIDQVVDALDKGWDFDPRKDPKTQARLDAIDRSWSEAAMAPDAGRAKRVFETGASRNADTGKLDYEAVLSPAVLERYAQYLHAHRVMEDGTLREMDNWQKGIPQSVYVKSAWRHFVEWWKWTRSPQVADKVIEEAVCGVLFNVMGWLHEHLKAKAARAAAASQSYPAQSGQSPGGQTGHSPGGVAPVLRS